MTLAICPGCSKYADSDLIHRRKECTECRNMRNPAPKKVHVREREADNARARRRARRAKVDGTAMLQRVLENTEARAKKAVKKLRMSPEDAASLVGPDMTVAKYVKLTGCSTFYARAALGHVHPGHYDTLQTRRDRRAAGLCNSCGDRREDLEFVTCRACRENRSKGTT